MNKHKLAILFRLLAAVLCVALTVMLLFNLHGESRIDGVYKSIHRAIAADPNCCITKTWSSSDALMKDPNITYIQLHRERTRKPGLAIMGPISLKHPIRSIKPLFHDQLFRTKTQDHIVIQTHTNRIQEEEDRIRKNINAMNPHFELQIDFYRSRIDTNYRRTPLR